MPLRFHVSWQVPLCLPSNCIMWCLMPQAVVKAPFQQCQMKAKVQWSRLMPEEMRRSGLARLCRKRNTMFAQRYKHDEWSLSFCEEHSAVSAPALLNKVLVLMLMILSAACRMVYLIYSCGPTSPKLLSLLPCCGNGDLEVGWMDGKCYCWPVRWCILCAGCVWERTEVLAMELASQ